MTTRPSLPGSRRHAARVRHGDGAKSGGRFPLDILVANLLAAFLLALVTALHGRQVLSDDVNMLRGAGIMGGMSTFSSFVCGSVVLMHASMGSAVVASVYVVVSPVLGYLAILVGEKLGGPARRPINAAGGGAP